jgi:carbon monoxide dehydrogenase subunit G
VQIEQSFTIKADPDTVYAFLLDVNRVVGCMPGVQLIEARGDDTFTGTMKVKVGPVSVQYKGTAQITSRDPATRMATLAAEGTEGVGAGAVKGTAVMTVTAQDDGTSTVRMVGDVQIAGRLAQFGRGIIEGVAKRLTGEMADCIRMQLEQDGSGDAPAPREAASISAFGLLGSVVGDRVRRRGN